MKIAARHYLAAFAAASVLLGAGAASADVKAGVDAWQAGNYAAAVKEWRAAADAGDADAQFNLGQAYKLGRGVPADLGTAQSWYEKAAQKGHSQAEANLGLILFQKGDRAKALPWLRKAADYGDPRAQYVLGTAMFNGDIVPKDWPRAYALMQRAAGQGLPQAVANLQQMDSYIPLAQRQQGLALARQMEAKAPARAAPAAVAVAASRPSSPAPAAAKPVAKPAAPRAPAAVAVAAGGGWRVQLGAFASAANARRYWDSLRAKAPVLGALQPSFVAAGTVTRLQAGGVANRAAADRVCGGVKAAGGACFPVAP